MAQDNTQEPVVQESNLSLLHKQLVKDDYAVPQDFNEFKSTFSNLENADKLHKQLLNDEYAIPSDYDQFLKTFELKKKDPSDYGLPSKEVFSKIWENVPKVSKKPTEFATPENAPMPGDRDADLPDNLKTPDLSLETPEYSGATQNILQTLTTSYLAKDRLETMAMKLATPDLTLKTPDEGIQNETTQDLIKKSIDKGMLKHHAEQRIMEIDKKLAELPDEQQPVGTILPSAGPYIAEPTVSDERKKLLTEKSEINQMMKDPTRLQYILGKAYNESLIGLGDAIINGEYRAPEEWLSKFDAKTLDDVGASVVSFMVGMPMFSVGGKLGAAAVKPIVNRIMEKSAEKMIKAGIPELVAKRMAMKGAASIVTTMASSAGALGGYTAISDPLSQWAIPGANFDDIKWSQTLKNTARDTMLGLGVGGLGYGTAMVSKTAGGIPGLGARMGAKAAVSTGGLAAESALFTYGGQLLEGKKLRDVTMKDYLTTVAMLGMLKAQNLAGKAAEAVLEPKKAVAGIYESIRYNPQKPGTGDFAVELNPLELSTLKESEYKKAVDKFAKDDVELGKILADENVPAYLKDKILWASRGVHLEGVNTFPDPKKIMQDNEYLTWYNKEGVLLERKRYKTTEEATQASIESGLQIKDDYMQMKAASLTVDERNKIIAQLNEDGVSTEQLVTALATPVKHRSTEVHKLVADYYKLIPKGEIEIQPVEEVTPAAGKTEEVKPAETKTEPATTPTLIKVKDFKTEEGDFSVYDVDKEHPGRADMFTVEKNKDGYIVRNALVPEEMRRKGLATDIYKKLNEESIAKTGKPLRSTQPRTLETGKVVHELSPDAEKLWDSFVKKGLAEKLGDKNYQFIAPKKETPTAPDKGKAPEVPPIKNKGKKVNPKSRTGIAMRATPNSFTDAVLQHFISGGRISRIDFARDTGYAKTHIDKETNKEVITAGTIGPEFKKYFQLISNEGTRLDVFTEGLANDFGITESEARKMIIQIMKDYPSTGKMLDRFEQLRPKEEVRTEEELSPEERKKAEDEILNEEVNIARENNEIYDLIKEAEGDAEIESAIRAFESEDNMGVMDWKRLQRHLDEDREFFSNSWVFDNLTESQVSKLKQILSKDGKANFEKINGEPPIVEGDGKGDELPGGTEVVEKPVTGKGEGKPVTAAATEQQAKIDAINKDYEKQIADKQSRIEKIYADMFKAINEAKNRPSLFGDINNLKKGAEKPLIPGEEQGFNLDEQAMERVKKPFLENIASIQKDIEALKQEQKGKIDTILNQKSIEFEEAPVISKQGKKEPWEMTKQEFAYSPLRWDGMPTKDGRGIFRVEQNPNGTWKAWTERLDGSVDYWGREISATVAWDGGKREVAYMDEKASALSMDRHQEAVKKALSEGKNIPENVLADYAGLKAPEVSPMEESLNAFKEKLASKGAEFVGSKETTAGIVVDYKLPGDKSLRQMTIFKDGTQSTGKAGMDIKPAEKKMWELTKEEYYQLNKDEISPLGDGKQGKLKRKDHDYIHQNIVKGAVERGEKVPENVLVEYPELQVKTKSLPELKSPEEKYSGEETNKQAENDLARGFKAFRTYFKKKGTDVWRKAYLTTSPDLTEKKAIQSAKNQLLNDAENVPTGREKEILDQYEFKAEEIKPTETTKVESDQAKIQELKNSLAEGEMILKSGKDVTGRKMSKEELDAVQRSVDSTKERLGLPKTEVKPEPEPPKAEVPEKPTGPAKTIRLKGDYNGRKQGTEGEIVSRPNMFVTEVKFPDGKVERIDNTRLEFIKEQKTESKKEDEFAEIRPKEEDIPTETARRAHMWTSFDPDRRGKQEQKEYVDQINKVIDEMSGVAVSPEQKAVLRTEIARYKQGYADKFKAYLNAASQTASAMITGPAKFPTARNEKKMRIADNRLQELIEWDKKAQKAIKKAILDARTPEEFKSDKWQGIQKNIDSNLETITGLDQGTVKGYNRALFVSSLQGFIERMAKNGQIEDVRMALDYIKGKQAGLKKPIFAPKNSVWDSVRVAEEAVKAKEALTQKGEAEVGKYPGVSIVNNYEAERVQIRMDEKPSPEVIKALTKEGWHWSPANGVWQRKNTPQAVNSAHRIVEQYYKPKEVVSEKTPEGGKEYQYKMQLRPFGIGTYPKSGFVKAEQDPTGGFEVLTYNRKLTPEERSHWSFTPLTEVSEIKGKTFIDKDPDIGKVELEWFGGDKYAKVKIYDREGNLADEIPGMNAHEILKNIEAGNWIEDTAQNRSAKEAKDLKIEPQSPDGPEGIAWDSPLPISTNEDPNYKSSDLNNAMSIRNMGRSLIANLGLKEGENVRTGLWKRFIRRSAAVFNPRSGVVRVNSINNIRTLSHELGHYIDQFVFDIRGITGAQGTDKKTGMSGKYSEIVDANGIKDPTLKKKKMDQLNEKFGKEVVAGVLQRNTFNRELQKFLKDVGYPSKKRTEGLAEFVYNYIVDPGQVIKSTPQFYAWFEKLIDNAPEVKTALTQARADWNRYDAQDPRMKVLTLFAEPKAKESFIDGIVKWDKDKTMYSWVNHLQYMKNLSNEWKKAVGPTAPTYKDPYYSAKTMMGIDGRAQQFLLYHPYQRAGKDIKIRKDIEGLISVLRPILGTAKDADFRGYLLAKDSLESHVQGRPQEAVMSKELAKSSIALWEKQYGVRELWDFQGKIQKYNEALLDFSVESGKMPKEIIDEIKKRHQYYVPLQRAFEEFEVNKGSKAISRDMLATSEKAVWSRHGSMKSVKDIYESMVANTYHILAAGERNIQLNNIKDALMDIQKYHRDKKIPKSIIEEIPPTDIKPYYDLETGEIRFSLVKEKPKSGKIMSVWQDGKVHYYDVAPDYYDNIFQQEPKVQEIMRVLSKPSRWLQAGAVVYDPTFPIRNIMRDQQSAWFYSKYAYLPTDFVKGVMSAVKKDEIYQKWLASGGDQSFLISMDQMMEKDYAIKKIGKTFERKWQVYRKNPLVLLQDFSRASEIGTRLGAFKNAYKKTKNVQLAAVESRDIAADYGIHGAKIRAALGLYPFLNARIQHTRSMIESAKDPAAFFIKGMAITAPALMNWLMNNQDEESTRLYQSLPSWRRLGMHNIRIPGTEHFFPIPKGFYGVMFGTSVEAALDAAIKEDPRIVEGLAKQLFKEFSPVGNWTEVIPFIARPGIEAWANKKGYTGKPIISESMKLLKPAEQYYASTPEIFKKMGEALNWSPVKIDHYVRSYTGGAGIGAVNILDETLQAIGLVDKKPEDTFTSLSRLPVFKAFLTERPIGLQGGYVSDFYETLDKVEQVSSTFNKYVKTEDYDALDKFMADPKNQKMYSFYEGNSTNINNFRAAITAARDMGYAVMKDDMLTNDEKKEEIRRINDVIQETALKFKDAYDNQKYFDYSKAMDGIVTKMKAEKKDYRRELVQQQNAYNPYWIQLRKQDKPLFDNLKQYGGLKDIDQRRTISDGMNKIELEMEDSRLFNERLIKYYGNNVKGFFGTAPSNYEKASKTLQPTISNPTQTQLEYMFDLAWRTAMEQTTSEFIMNPPNKTKK